MQDNPDPLEALRARALVSVKGKGDLSNGSSESTEAPLMIPISEREDGELTPDFQTLKSKNIWHVENFLDRLSPLQAIQSAQPHRFQGNVHKKQRRLKAEKKLRPHRHERQHFDLLKKRAPGMGEKNEYGYRDLTLFVTKDTSSPSSLATLKPTFAKPVSPCNAERAANLKEALKDAEDCYAKNEALISKHVNKQQELKEEIKKIKGTIAELKVVKSKIIELKASLQSELASIDVASAKEITKRASSEAVPGYHVESLLQRPSKVKEKNTALSEAQSPLMLDGDAGMFSQHSRDIGPSTDRPTERAALERQLELIEAELELEQGKLEIQLKRNLQLEPGTRTEASPEISLPCITSATSPLFQPKASLFRKDCHLVPLGDRLIPSDILAQVFVPSNDARIQLRESSSEAYPVHHVVFDDLGYESPLRWLRDCIFLDNYPHFVHRTHAASPTFINKINPSLPMCSAELLGHCPDLFCGFQHLDRVVCSDEEALQYAIDRLLRLERQNTFKDQSEVLAFIYEQLSEIGVQEQPIGILIQKVLHLRPIISVCPLRVLRFDDHLDLIAKTKKSMSEESRLKSLAANLLNIAGRPFLRTTKLIVESYWDSISVKLANIVPEASAVEQQLKGLMDRVSHECHRSDIKAMINVASSQFAQYPESELLCLVIVDLLFLSTPLPEALDQLKDAIDAFPDMVLLKWIFFMKSPSFDVKYAAASDILSYCENSDGTSFLQHLLLRFLELVTLILALAKMLLDAEHWEDVHDLFNVVLNRQKPEFDQHGVHQKISESSSILGFDEIARILLFYLNFLQSDSYQRHMFLQTPYEWIYNCACYPLIHWSRNEHFAFALESLRKLIACYTDGPSMTFSCLMFNYLNLNAVLGQDLIKDFEALLHDERFGEYYELLLHSLDPISHSPEDIGPMALAYRVARLMAGNHPQEAYALLQNWLPSMETEAYRSSRLITLETFGLTQESDTAQKLLFCFYAALQGKLNDALNQILDTDFRTVLHSSSFLTQLPSAIDEILPAFDSTLVEELVSWNKPEVIEIVDAERLSPEELIAQIRLHPTDSVLWIRFIDYATKEGWLTFLPRLVKAARQWCPLNAKLEHVVV